MGTRWDDELHLWSTDGELVHTGMPFGQVGGSGALYWRRLAQRRLRQVLALLDDGKVAELGEAFVLVEEAEVAMDMLLQREEAGHG